MHQTNDTKELKTPSAKLSGPWIKIADKICDPSYQNVPITVSK